MRPTFTVVFHPCLSPLASADFSRYARTMSRSELDHLELLAEVDALVERLNRWADDVPGWQPAEKCRALARRLTQRAGALRVRIEAPLVVATLGGTGTGKSALVNAIVGTEVVQTGRSRPTTTRPTLVCRPGLTPEVLGIDPATVERIESDAPALRDLVLVDCPDPDTTEEEESASAAPRGLQSAGVSSDSPLSSLPSPLSPSSDNLARLRAILPHCDVLLVASTQQKYRSARVAAELAAAACGAHLVFVQTHADQDADIRDDWRQAMDTVASGQWPVAGEHIQDSTNDLPSPACGRGGGGEGGVNQPQPALTLTLSQRERGPEDALSQRERGPKSRIFRIDSLRSLADARAGLQPRGEMADLLDLLTRQMAGAAGNRIRRANFLDLVAQTLDACRWRMDEAMPAVGELQSAIDQQRAVLSQKIVGEMQNELLLNRRLWENRLLAQTTSRWGFSPFSLVLRVYQGIGGLLAGALLYRARTPAQVALWGAMQGMRTWRRHRRDEQGHRGVDRAAAGGWDSADLRQAAIIIEGYLSEAGLWDRHSCLSQADKNVCPTLAKTLAAEAEVAAGGFVARVSADLESLVGRLARRHTGWFTRWR